MNGYLDRIAQAIWRSDPAHTPMKWEECDLEFRKIKRAQARAAIEAMREPSEKMKLVVDPRPPNGSLEPYWQAMIDAALEED